jgi:hypothetical protein
MAISIDIATNDGPSFTEKIDTSLTYPRPVIYFVGSTRAGLLGHPARREHTASARIHF